MIEKTYMQENAVVFKSKTHSVRVKKHGEKMMFCASDIVSACGIKAPRKWMNRITKRRPDITGITLSYPVMSTTGIRHFNMFFVTVTVARKIIDLLACPDETKNWLMNEVLSYRIEGDKEDGEITSEDMIVGEVEVIDTSAPSAIVITETELGRMIDRVLLDLLEIKRCVANGEYRE